MLMSLTSTLYRNSVSFFAAFFGLVLWGFWNSYYSNTRMPMSPAIVDQGAITPIGYVFSIDAILVAVLFALLYALAIFNRRVPAVHARLCTTLPIVASATDRGLENYFPGVVERLPQVPEDRSSAVPRCGYSH
jgi:hypothetical protein